VRRASITNATVSPSEAVQFPIDNAWTAHDWSDDDGTPPHFTVNVLGAGRLAAIADQGFEMDPASENLSDGRNHRGSPA
jgi:hypothetical protein